MKPSFALLVRLASTRAIWLAIATSVLLDTNPLVAQELAPSQNFFQGAARQRAFVELKRLEEIQKKHLDQISARPGVTGIGITADRGTGRLIFLIAIHPDAEMPALPDEIEGVPVQIQRLPGGRQSDGGPANVSTPFHGDLTSLPVEMGNSAHTRLSSACPACSLGFKACDVLNDLTVYVTAAHCGTDPNNYCAGTGTGFSTYHRAPFDDPFCLGDSNIGTVLYEQPVIPGFFANLVDAASVSSDFSQTQYAIRDIGLPSSYPGGVLPFDVVQKSGRTTGHTIGIVWAMSYSLWVTGPTICPGGSAGFVGQILAFLPTNDGDSGSALLNLDVEGGPPEVVGLIHSRVGTAYAVATPIAMVLTYLHLSLEPADCSIPCTISFASQTNPDRASLLRTCLNFRDYVLARSERGRRYIEMYYRVTDDIVKIMLTRPRLYSATVTLLEKFVPLIRAISEHQPVTITRQQIEEVDKLLARYAAISSDSDLSRAMNRLRRDLRDPEILREFGVTLKNGITP